MRCPDLATQDEENSRMTADGPDEENARGPRVTVCVRGTYSILSSADRRRERPVTAATGTQYNKAIRTHPAALRRALFF